jgi:sporulation protein YlmC with PRC-barrel domain
MVAVVEPHERGTHHRYAEWRSCRQCDGNASADAVASTEQAVRELNTGEQVMAKDKHVTDTGSRLIRLEELKGFKVAEGDRDIRGWSVKTPDGKKVGKVEELIVDPAERRVRYIEIKADHKALGVDDDRHILVPIGSARLDEKGDDVLLERLPAQGLAGVPPWKRGPITREYETSLRNYYGAAAVDSGTEYYRDDLYSEKGFQRKATADGSADDRSWLPRLGDNEVTVPLVGDQEVIVRRPGSNEEIVIRKTRADTDEARG